jgi:hypothetical protein
MPCTLHSYLTFTLVLLSLGSQTGLGQYLAAAGELKDWRERHWRDVKPFPGSKTNDPLTPGYIHIIVCTKREGDKCKGDCWDYQGPQEPQCLTVPGNGTVNCMAATAPVSMCAKSDCSTCNEYTLCGTTMHYGFCSTPNTQSIQFSSASWYLIQRCLKLNTTSSLRR